MRSSLKKLASASILWDLGEISSSLHVYTLMHLRLRASANRLRSAARSSLPTIATPSFSNEFSYDDDHLGEGNPEVDHPSFPLRTPHQLLMGVVPRVRALHSPTFRRLKRRRLAFLGDHGEQP